MRSVLFVCLGNICRSPTAHGVFHSLIEASEHKISIRIDSAGTSAYHVGSLPDIRMMSTAKLYGYDLSFIRSREVTPADFSEFELILAMDEENFEDLMSSCPQEQQHKLKLFLDYHPETDKTSVPDPYYGGQAGFDEVVKLVEVACKNLLAEFI